MMGASWDCGAWLQGKFKSLLPPRIRKWLGRSRAQGAQLDAPFAAQDAEAAAAAPAAGRGRWLRCAARLLGGAARSRSRLAPVGGFVLRKVDHQQQRERRPKIHQLIALFYSSSLAMLPLAAASLLLMFIYLMRRIGVLNPAAYLIPGLLLWLAVLRSGVHATIAGVMLGLLTPAVAIYTKSNFAETASSLLARFRMAVIDADKTAAEESLGKFEVLTVGTEAPAQRLIRFLEPWVIYIVLPIFALANAGVNLGAVDTGKVVGDPITLGVFPGLVLGKPLGIFALTWITVGISPATLPNGVRWLHMVGIGILGGIGFTVALFMTDLSFDSETLIAHAKLAIMTASLVAGTIGYLTLRRACSRETVGVEVEPEIARGIEFPVRILEFRRDAVPQRDAVGDRASRREARLRSRES